MTTFLTVCLFIVTALLMFLIGGIAGIFGLAIIIVSEPDMCNKLFNSDDQK